MGLSLGELATIAGAELRGDPDRVIERVETLQDATAGAISFLANPQYRKFLAETAASAVIVAPGDVAHCHIDCLVSDNPYLAHARVTTALYPDRAVTAGVHPGAVVDSTAQVHPTAEVAANAYVGERAVIGEGVFVGPGCVVLEDCEIGSGSRLVAMATLGPRTRLGQRCLIHPGAVIGGDGFGLANDAGAWVKVPQIGRAWLGDDVEVGSCSSIDRGAIGNTVIDDGVKIDSQVHVAHNVTIGRHTAMAGCAGIAGSTHIGAYCTVAGGVGITGHVELADHVHVSGATAVTRSIKKPGVYTGTVPAMEHASWLKNFARLRHLDDMVRRLRQLEKEMATLRESTNKGT
ncbi:MAG: UDP-3-O-(3-hydroxymyristoyl)glucosamine N-acyltransferase [Gammaproteobacteria bacterium]|nr:UDP-3-O-(3-hydroxymyristoyl)glucosamine N-acyltransferase [Gammaproteobacteria bacterium]